MGIVYYANSDYINAYPDEKALQGAFRSFNGGWGHEAWNFGGFGTSYNQTEVKSAGFRRITRCEARKIFKKYGWEWKEPTDMRR